MPKKKKIVRYPSLPLEEINPLDGVMQETNAAAPLHLIYENPAHGIWLYHDNCLAVLDAIYAKHPEGRFDMIFADPPYFLSNGGITCHAGKMVKVDKGGWDKSCGWEWNHEFNTEWLRRCQRVLKPNGTLWVTGTHHVIFSVGYAMQQLGYKILNDIAWEKPNPPPNLSCRYFTHSTETILWAAKNEDSKHVFNYQEMRKVTGKQMKTVWRAKEFTAEPPSRREENESQNLRASAPPRLDPIWTMSAPGNVEKLHGKHPTQKPIALIERCILASTHPRDLILDPFLGGGTTAVASVRLGRAFMGVEMDFGHLELARKRADYETVLVWLRNFRVRIEIALTGRAATPLAAGGVGSSRCDDRQDERTAQRAIPSSKIDLDLFGHSMDRIRLMDDKPQVPTERIFHECKFVFLSCAQVERGAVVHTTVDVSLQEAWTKTPNGKKRETTHVVRCETEIFRVKSPEN